MHAVKQIQWRSNDSIWKTQLLLNVFLSSVLRWKSLILTLISWVSGGEFLVRLKKSSSGGCKEQFAISVLWLTALVCWRSWNSSAVCGLAGLCFKLFYVQPDKTSGTVKKGKRLGTMLPMQLVYPGITSHVHVQMCDNSDPTPYFWGWAASSSC